MNDILSQMSEGELLVAFKQTIVQYKRIKSELALRRRIPIATGPLAGRLVPGWVKTVADESSRCYMCSEPVVYVTAANVDGGEILEPISKDGHRGPLECPLNTDGTDHITTCKVAKKFFDSQSR